MRVKTPNLRLQMFISGVGDDYRRKERLAIEG
jgi:hypothetical protein